MCGRTALKIVIAYPKGNITAKGYMVEELRIFRRRAAKRPLMDSMTTYRE